MRGNNLVTQITQLEEDRDKVNSERKKKDITDVIIDAMDELLNNAAELDGVREKIKWTQNQINIHNTVGRKRRRKSTKKYRKKSTKKRRKKRRKSRKKSNKKKTKNRRKSRKASK